MSEKQRKPYVFNNKLMEDITIGGFQNMLNEYCKSATGGDCKMDCDDCIFSDSNTGTNQDCNDFIISDLSRAAYMLYREKYGKQAPIKKQNTDVAKDDIAKLISYTTMDDPKTKDPASTLLAVEYFRMLDEMRDADPCFDMVIDGDLSTEEMITYVIKKYDEFKEPKKFTYFDKFIDDNHITDSQAIMQIKGMCNDGSICRDKVFGLDNGFDNCIGWACNSIKGPDCKMCWEISYNADIEKQIEQL